jgi:hypothetical protein
VDAEAGRARSKVFTVELTGMQLLGMHCSKRSRERSGSPWMDSVLERPRVSAHGRERVRGLVC